MVIMMNNYEQHMKHWKSHRKDRYYQQCSGYCRIGNVDNKGNVQTKNMEEESFKKILDKAKNESFPIYISSLGGYWFVCDKNNLFGTMIASYEELEQFGRDYVFNENDYS